MGVVVIKPATCHVIRQNDESLAHICRAICCRTLNGENKLLNGIDERQHCHVLSPKLDALAGCFK